MNLHRLWTVALLLLLAVARAESQEVVVGSAECCLPTFNISSSTFINPADSAAVDGQVTTALARFGMNGPCPGSTFRLRFYHPDGTGLAMIAERGPFPIDAKTKIVALEPPVDLQKNDVMGLYQQTTGPCGVAATYGSRNDVVLKIDGDFRGGPIVASYDMPRHFRFAFRASSQKLVLVGIVPVIGAQAGAFGSQFRTSFQIANSDFSEPIQSLKFVYHPRGVATAGDPSTTMDLVPNATSAADLIGQMNITGVGSLDVYSPLWSPNVTARVYNDTGSGTNGFSEPMIPLSMALHGGEFSRIAFPADLANYRMNVGIRTLGSPVTIAGHRYDAAGNDLGSISVTYAANFFDQVPLATFIGGTPTDGGSAVFQAIGGDAIIYSTTTDNRTNDSAITLATRD